MFGISLVEFFTITLLAILIIGPKDFPYIARNVIKMIAKGKNIINDLKSEIKILSKETGLEDIKNEVEMEIEKEKKELEDEITTIIDIYGNEHQVPSLGEVRGDKTKEEIAAEVKKYNKINQQKKS